MCLSIRIVTEGIFLCGTIRPENSELKGFVNYGQAYFIEKNSLWSR